MKKYLLLGILGIFSCQTIAQVKIGDNAETINSNSLLELESTDKDVLISRVELLATSNFAPLTAHVAGMLVYNVATVSNVTPGFYYND
jgi:hypothetical protein